MRRTYKLLLVLLALGVLFIFYFPGLSKYLKLKHQEERLSYDLADLKAKLDDLKKEADLIKNDTLHLEEVLRKEMGLVKPGEVVYKFVPTESKSDEPATQN